MVHHRAGWLNPVFEGLTYAGRFGLIWIGIALLLAILYRRWGLFALTAIAIAVTDVAVAALKALIDRPRPPLRYAEPEPLVRTSHDASFPSGHAATSFVAATILSFAFPRLRAPFAVLAAAVAFSRVYVGVHYPLDVVGGAVLGILIAALLAWLIQRRVTTRSRSAGGQCPTWVEERRSPPIL